jgi:hypothetical protein
LSRDPEVVASYVLQKLSQREIELLNSQVFPAIHAALLKHVADLKNPPKPPIK